MAGTVTTDFTTIDAAEATTGWLALGTISTAAATNNDVFVQSANALTCRVSGGANVSGWQLATASPAANLNTGNHVFAWIKDTTWPSTDTKANGGMRIAISSDATPTLTGTYPSNGPTNGKTWFVGGNDTDTVTGWTCYVVDPTSTANVTNGSPTMTAIQKIGWGAGITQAISTKTLNLIWDIVKYGTGLTIRDGTGQTPLAFSDIFSADSSTSNAFGVLTSVSGVYYGAGKITIGTASQPGMTAFKDSNQTIVYQNFPVASTFYELKLVGASGPKTTFHLGTYNPASGLTSAGCVIKGAGNVSSTSHAIWTLTSSDANQVTKLYNCNFSELKNAALSYNIISLNVTSCTTTINVATISTTNNFNTAGVVTGMLVTGTGIAADTYVSTVDSNTQITLNKNASASGTVTLTFQHSNEMRGCTFNNFGDITTNGCLIDNCTFQNLKIGAPISATYALIINSTTEMGRVTNSKFITCNRAIKITTSGTYAFSGLTFSGNAYDIENSSAGLVTINVTGGGNSPTYINTGGGSVVVNNPVTLKVTALDTSNNKLQNIQVWIQKDPSSADYGHDANPFTSGAGNNQGNGSFVVTQAPPGDLPSSGWLIVQKTSSGTNTTQSYRYLSRSGSTFTFNTAITGIDNGTGNSTTLNETGIGAKNIVEGDTIRNTTNGQWAVVMSVSTNSVTTTALSGGATWAGKNYSVHTLALTYTSGTDTASVPLMNQDTDLNGAASVSINLVATMNIVVRARTSSGGTNYLPYSTSGTVDSSGYNGTLVLTTDTIRS